MKENDGKVVLFLSADIADSTAYKLRVGNESSGRPAWLPAFEKFFKELPLVFIGQVALAFEEEQRIPDTGVWKVGGDEIIFSASIDDPKECGLLLAAFCNTVTRYDDRLAEIGLRLQGCVWGAMFPNPNIEIEIPEMAAAGNFPDSVYLDYLGPDIDAGFRLAKFAEPGEVITSLNVALTIASDKNCIGLEWALKGHKPLKGLFSQTPYPLVVVSVPKEEKQGDRQGVLILDDLEAIAFEFAAEIQDATTTEAHIRLF